MAGIIYNKNCGTRQVQTRISDCLKKQGKNIAFLLSGVNASYPLDPTEFNEGLFGTTNKAEAYLYRSDYLRLTPITEVRLTTPNGGDALTEDAGYNETSIVSYNPQYDVYRINGDVCLYKQLVKYDKQYVRLFEIDEQSDIFGTQIKEEFAGYKAQIGVREVKATATTAYYIELTVYYSPEYRNERENAHAIPLDSIPQGFLGVRLIKGTTTGTATVNEYCGNVDITARFGNDWESEMFENTAGVVPTSIAYLNGLITFTPTGSYKVRTADYLISQNIDGFEGINEYTSLT